MWAPAYSTCNIVEQNKKCIRKKINQFDKFENPVNKMVLTEEGAREIKEWEEGFVYYLR